MALNYSRRPEPASGIPASKARWYAVWNAERVAVLVALGLFIAYGTFRAFENAYFETSAISVTLFRDGIVPNYLSPFYSPPLHHLPGWHPALSPALFLLAFPGTFRFTCYFCRRTYYRAIFGTPPGCAAKEVLRRSTRYSGEQEFPLYLQNLHRYALYAVFVFVAFHWLHLFQGFFFQDAQGETRFGIGVGTLVVALDAVCLTLYVGSCHSFRHLVGGILNRFSNARGRFKVWHHVSRLNERHGLYFWLSLVTVALADLYIRSVCAGWIQDLHFVF